MGAFYSFGNMSTYLTSYMRQAGSPNLTYTGILRAGHVERYQLQSYRFKPFFVTL
jgi:hypothetical protein